MNYNPSELIWSNNNFDEALNYSIDSRIVVWEWLDNNARVFIMKPSGMWFWTIDDSNYIFESSRSSLVISNYDSKYWWAWIIKNIKVLNI